ncbi:MAG: hypothetical protein JJ864_08660 [Rhizobiaceae bacterium]|nr:hypothetical protein [Rhizobiaceae bacterium]
MSDERFQFWLVWHEDGGTPRFRHQSKQSALDEATRLAKLTPGECFFVLKATAGVIANEPDVRHVKFVVDPIPF